MRYLVFSGSEYYASGGANDLVSATENKKDAIAYAKSEGGDDTWSQVYDLREKVHLQERNEAMGRCLP